jgi:hypothetical protein
MINSTEFVLRIGFRHPPTIMKQAFQELNRKRLWFRNALFAARLTFAAHPLTPWIWKRARHMGVRLGGMEMKFAFSHHELPSGAFLCFLSL